MCSDPNDEDLLHPAVRNLWIDLLKQSHPRAETHFDSLDPDKWHEHYRAGINLATDPVPIFRHMGEAKNLFYKKTNEVSAEDRKKYFEEVRLPMNKIGNFKEDAFDKTVKAIVEAWQKMFRDIENSTLENCDSYIRNWNLDTGVDEDRIDFWFTQEVPQ